MRSTCSNRIPVIIVSGFLGAGKTTFIQKLVSPSLDRDKTVILENEFGNVDFDGPQLRKRGVSVVSIFAGCICCTGVGNFTGAIQEVAEDFSPRLIIIEPTGVAKLSEILTQFKLPPLMDLCYVKQAITVVDAKNFEKRFAVSEEFYEDQLETTDVAVLSKTEGLDREVINAVTRQIHGIAPGALIIDRPWEDLSADELETCQGYRSLQVRGGGHVNFNACVRDDDHADEHGRHDDGGHERDDNHEDGHEHDHHHQHDREHDYESGHGHGHDHDHEDEDGHGHRHDHSHAFMAYSFEPTCSAEVFKESLNEISSLKFGKILRIKGFLRSSQGAWMKIDYVPGELQITETVDESQDISSQLVFIGAGLKEQAIAGFFASVSR